MSNAPPTSHRISEFHKWNKEASLELAPPFQRKPVWSQKNKSFLIDTILRQLPVPEIYIQVRTDAEGNTEYIVVDGQQRIRSILEFIEGEYSLLEDECPHYADKSFQDLPSPVKRDFWDYPIVTRELKTESEAEVKNIFLRLNKYVVPLNRQELRNATYGGHFIHVANRIADEDDFWADNRIVTPSQIKRMIDAEYISELFIAMIHGIQKKEQDAIDGFYKMYDETFTDREDWVKKFKATENRIEGIFGAEMGSTRWRRKPDFYSLFLAVYELSKDYYFPEDRFEDIRDALVEFASEVDLQTKRKNRTKGEGLVQDYVSNVTLATTNRETRFRRYEIVRELVIPHLVARDRRRSFTEEERRIKWAMSKERKCAICGEPVEWENYQLDHTKPHSKGGRTELRNSQITHKSCNLKKSDK